MPVSAILVWSLPLRHSRRFTSPSRSCTSSSSHMPPSHHRLPGSSDLDISTCLNSDRQHSFPLFRHFVFGELRRTLFILERVLPFVEFSAWGVSKGNGGWRWTDRIQKSMTVNFMGELRFVGLIMALGVLFHLVLWPFGLVFFDGSVYFGAYAAIQSACR